MRDAVDFVELVSARTELRRAGPASYEGLCPFHDERTPSFGIDPGQQGLLLLRLPGQGGRVHVRAGDRGGRLQGCPGAARRPLRDRAGARGRGSPRGGAPPPARAAAGAAGAHRRLLRALPVGVERGGTRAGVPGESRARGGGPAGVRSRLLAERVGPGAAGLAPRRVLRAGAVRDRPGAALALGRAPVRPLPWADHVPAARHPRAGARLRGARAERRSGRACSEVPEHLRQRRLPQGSAPVRRRRRARARGARRPGDPVRGLHRRDRAAPGGDAQRGGPDGHGADGRAGRASWRGWPRRCCSRWTPTPPARRRCCAPLGWPRSGSLELRVVALPGGMDPAEAAAARGAERMAAAVGESVPFVRFRVERVLAAGRLRQSGGPRSHDRRAAADLRDAGAERDANGAHPSGRGSPGAAGEPRRDAARDARSIPWPDRAARSLPRRGSGGGAAATRGDRADLPRPVHRLSAGGSAGAAGARSRRALHQRAAAPRGCAPARGAPLPNRWRASTERTRGVLAAS